MRADAADKRVGGAVKATMDMQVDEASADTSNLTIVTDAQVMGRIGEFGQPIIRKKADQIMQEFAKNLSKEVSA
jgi:carbon monoxide dehydrogenase subunit G